MNDEITIFCDNIRMLMEENNLSDTGMAKIMHVGVKNLRLIKNGELPPSVTTRNLFYICDYFKIHPKDLFE